MPQHPRKTLSILFFTLLIDMIGIGMILPVLPVLFTDPNSPEFLLTGYSSEAQFVIAGAITALFGLMQFFAAPILGELSDVFGRKKLLVLGVGILAFSQLLFGLGIETASLSLLFISRLIAGLAGANFSIAQASIADITPPNERAKNFGLIGAAFGIGFILGPLLGGILSKAFSAATPFFVASGLGILNTLSLSLLFQETLHKRSEHTRFHILKGIQNIRAAWNDVDARPVYLSSFLYMSGFTFFTSFIGVLLVQRYGYSEAAIGSFFGFVGIWIVITQGFLLRIVSKHANERTTLRISIPCVALAIAAFPFLSNPLFLYVLVPLLSIPQGLSMAHFGALVSKSVSPSKQGAALGINGSLMAFSQGVIPLLAGFGSGFIGITAPFLAGSLFVASAWYALFRSK